MSWTVSQLAERTECVDKFDVGVRNLAGQELRKLCSVPSQAGLKEFHCKLDLSDLKYCDNKFGFWVTAVNINHNRGVERVQSFANTVVEVKCGGQDTEPQKVSLCHVLAPDWIVCPQVLSDSCLAVSPGWTSRPLIEQTGEATLR